MPEPFAHTLRVRYAECDQQGVVFNAHYLAYFDLGITELWRAAFGGYQAMLERGIDMVVAEAQLRFHRAARFDELITLEITVASLGTTSIVTSHLIRSDDQPVVKGTLRHVLVDPQTLQKSPIPAWMREGLGPWTQAAA